MAKHSKGVLTDQRVVEEAARRVYRGHLHLMLRSHGYDSPESLYGEVWEKACDMEPKYDPAKGSVPATYLAAGAARAIKKRLRSLARSVYVPFSRRGESDEMRALKQAAHSVVSIDKPGGSDFLASPQEDTEDEEPPGFYGTGHAPTQRGLSTAGNAGQTDDEFDEAEGGFADVGEDRIFPEDEESHPQGGDERTVLTRIIETWGHCGVAVLEVFAEELGKLDVKDAWARAVNAAASRLACAPGHVRSVIVATIQEAATRSGNTRREVQRRGLEIETLLKRNGKRGPYKKRNDTPGP